MTLAIDEPDPGDDLPDIVVGPEYFAERRHRADDVLRTLAHEALFLECVSRIERARAERDDAEQSVVIVSNWRLDVLYGVKTLDNRLAVRVSGT
jgi:hypothetical protein